MRRPENQKKPTLGGERKAVRNRLIGYVCEESAEYETGDGRRLLFRLGWERDACTFASSRVGRRGAVRYNFLQED
ncbi:MAG: hypothetical protein ACOC7S_01060 [Planctomycetota bacterium]